MSQSHGLSSRGAAPFPGATCGVRSSGVFPRRRGKVSERSMREEQDGAVTRLDAFAPRCARRTVLAGHEGQEPGNEVLLHNCEKA